MSEKYSLLEQYKQIQDENGLISYHPTQPLVGQHNIRHTAECLIILEANGITPPASFTDKIKLGLKFCEPNPGYLKRVPGNSSIRNSHDNIRGGLICDLYLQTGFAKRFLDLKWESRLWYLLPGYVDDQLPGSGFKWGAWQYRFQDMYAMADMVVGDRLNRFQDFMIRMVLDDILKTKTQDGFVFGVFLTTLIKKRQYFHLVPDVREFSSKFKQINRLGLGDYLGKYLGSMNHPSAQGALGFYG